MAAEAAIPRRHGWLHGLAFWRSRDTSESVASLEARYENEWMAVDVAKSNRLGIPTRGTLIAHSRDHDEVIASIRGRRGSIMVVYNGPPQGTVILSVGLPVRS